MTRLESITDIRHTLFHLRLQQDMIGDDEALKTFQTAHEQLLNRFYNENEDLMSIQQYKVAKRDVEYFMQLVDLAYWLCMNENKKGLKTNKNSTIN